ncbi:MAG: ferritin-like domain-containing protein [Stellaceae bacterium]
MSEIENPEQVPHHLNRRQLVLKASLATFAAIGVGNVTAIVTTPTAAQAQQITDAAILNFALNLEYLEAEYYLRAVTGHGLPPGQTTGQGAQGQVFGGMQVPFSSSAVQQYAAEIARDEHAHVRFLRKALGSAAIAEPAIDLVNSFYILAQAAGLGDSFNPFISDENFLIGAYVFEDVGVTAYHGAASLIQNKDVLDAAAGILAVEAYHAANIRTAMYERGIIDPTIKISALRRQLGDAIDRGIVVGGKAHIVQADRNGIAPERTPAEVLNIVYAGGASGDFGFFPNRVNGEIQ